MAPPGLAFQVTYNGSPAPPTLPGGYEVVATITDPEYVGSATGTSSLDNEGKLRIRGNAQANITVTSVLGIPFGECKTEKPVDFPLVFDGPVSSLGNGGLTFQGTTTFPQIKGYFISAILSALISGSGQTYSFTVAPPAPVRY